MSGRPLKKMFNTKPGCFSKYNKNWTLCTQQCNFRMDCMKAQTHADGKARRSKIVGDRSVSEALGSVDRKSNESLEDFYERDWEKRMSKQGISYVPKTTPKRKPKPKARVFHMPPRPSTRLVFGSVTDVNMAIMFGLYKYGEVVRHMVPSDIASEYDRIMLESDELFKDQRLGKLKDAVSRHWNSWGEFIQFMEN